MSTVNGNVMNRPMTSNDLTSSHPLFLVIPNDHMTDSDNAKSCREPEGHTIVKRSL